MPFKVDLDGAPEGGPAKFLSQFQGAFEVERDPDAVSRLVQQVTVDPIHWKPLKETRDPSCVFGDNLWRDYAVEGSVEVPAGGYGGIVGRLQPRGLVGDFIDGHGLVVSDGACKLMRFVCGEAEEMASVKIGEDKARLRLEFRGEVVSGYCDGKEVGSFRDGANQSGAVGLISDWCKTAFWDISVVPHEEQ